MNILKSNLFDAFRSGKPIPEFSDNNNGFVARQSFVVAATSLSFLFGETKKYNIQHDAKCDSFLLNNWNIHFSVNRVEWTSSNDTYELWQLTYT